MVKEKVIATLRAVVNRIHEEEFDDTPGKRQVYFHVSQNAPWMDFVHKNTALRMISENPWYGHTSHYPDPDVGKRSWRVMRTGRLVLHAENLSST